MEIQLIKSADFEVYSESLVDLYIDTFSSGKSFQYHSRTETQNYLHSIFEVGYGIFAMVENQLVGAILITPLSFDQFVPEEITRNFSLNKSIYVAEMMIEKTRQGQGIGKHLLLHFFETVDRNMYTDAFIRVWIENESAVALYKKVGFKTCAKIVQSKLLSDKSKMHDFKKIYLHQKIKD